MRALQPCPHVLRLHAVAFSGPKGAEQEAVLLMDLAAGSLPAHLAARGYKLDDGEVLAIFLPICRAIHAMHSLSPPVAHRCVMARAMGGVAQGKDCCCLHHHICHLPRSCIHPAQRHQS